jgi:hypothetical protein
MRYFSGVTCRAGSGVHAVRARDVSCGRGGAGVRKGADTHLGGVASGPGWGAPWLRPSAGKLHPR